MTTKTFSRREFIKKNSLTGLGLLAAPAVLPSITFSDSSPDVHDLAFSGGSPDTPALLGGTPVHTKGWPEWPVWNQATDEKQLLEVMRSGVWSRAKVTDEFEKKWAQLMGSKRCLSVVNGTSALIAALTQADVGGGDEVIVPPYTFIATVAAVLMTGAMPVFADVDRATFQINPKEIEKKITPRTRAIMPVHILGLPADMIANHGHCQKTQPGGDRRRLPGLDGRDQQQESRYVRSCWLLQFSKLQKHTDGRRRRYRER